MNAIVAMLNIFIDPKAAVERFQGKKWAWVWPILVMGIGAMAIGWVTTPVTIRVMLQSPPPGVNPDQLRNSISMIETAQKVTVVLTPLFLAAITALTALVLMAACSVLDIQAGFRDLFTMLAHCGLVSFLGAVATGAYIYLRGDEFQRLADLQPAFGLDLFLADDANRLLRGVLGYFTVYNIWYIVVLGLAFAALARIPRGKAFTATAPVWLLGMLFTVAASVFRRF